MADHGHDWFLNDLDYQVDQMLFFDHVWDIRLAVLILKILRNF